MTNLVSYEDASEEVRTVYDDIKRIRNVERVSNFWMAIANHPPTLRRTWESIKEIMVDGADEEKALSDIIELIADGFGE